MPLGKYQKAKGSNSTNYGEKTSKHGHYAPKHSYAGTNSDGSSWKSHEMEWVEDNRSFSQPKQQQNSQQAAAPKPKDDLVIKPSTPKNQEERKRENPLVPKNPDLSKYPAPEKKGPFDQFLPTPVDPNRDYRDSPFSKHESKVDYTFSPQAQEAKERAANFQNAFERS